MGLSWSAAVEASVELPSDAPFTPSTHLLTEPVSCTYSELLVFTKIVEQGFCLGT